MPRGGHGNQRTSRLTSGTVNGMSSPWGIVPFCHRHRLRGRVAARKAWPSNARVMCRYHPPHRHTSYGPFAWAPDTFPQRVVAPVVTVSRDADIAIHTHRDTLVAPLQHQVRSFRAKDATPLPLRLPELLLFRWPFALGLSGTVHVFTWHYDETAFTLSHGPVSALCGFCRVSRTSLNASKPVPETGVPRVPTASWRSPP